MCNQDSGDSDTGKIGEQILPTRRAAAADAVINFFGDTDDERAAHGDLPALWRFPIQLLVKKIKLGRNQTRARDGMIEFIFAEPRVRLLGERN